MNKLNLFVEYKKIYYPNKKIKEKSPSKILKKFKKHDNDIDNVFIESKLNGEYFPIFELNSSSKLEIFKELFKDVPYIIFEFESDHESYHYCYWVFLNGTTKDIIFDDTKWLSLNDEKFVNFCLNRKKILIKSLFMNEKGKPTFYEKNKPSQISYNLEYFTSLLEDYYSNFGLELSCLKYKKEDLLKLLKNNY